MLHRFMHVAVDYLERIIALLLVVIAGLGAVDLVVEMYSAVSETGYLTPDSILRVLDSVLVVFIVIELFNIALAYMRRKNVIATVMEAGLVAVVRKLVIFESGGDATYVLMKAAALALLIVAIGLTWYLLRRSGVCEAEGNQESAH
ncbi:MAG: phosphate-starvation-inducible PsiE family protein [Coriobacteriia bacterium]|nr:phosphate-starvation-inducible PsiE family protein [Coriobacteriia bacterium]MBN2822724.1 phosphate-starvation-inducible PsiE family protein [Coriobacteriia bacterium]